MSVFKRAIDNVVHKARTISAANGLKAQRKVKEDSITQTINRLKLQRESIHNKIGHKCFEMHLGGSFIEEELHELFAMLKDIKANIDAQERLLEETNRKYEEEMALLKSGVSQIKIGECPNCGMVFSSGIDLFCRECGTDLRKIEANSPVKAACPGCGDQYNPETASFCKKCGHNLRDRSHITEEE